MDYQLNDILECIEIFSTETNYIGLDSINKYHRVYSGRVINNGDVYFVENLNYRELYIKHTPSGTKQVIYAETIPVPIELIDKFFKCKSVERKRKLDKLNDIT